MKAYSALVLVLGCAIFATAGSAAADPCPNEAFRVGPSAGLAGCRAYEMVSPPEKDGGAVTPRFLISSSPDGNAVSFFSTAAFAGSEGSSLGVPYRAARADGAWSTQGVEAPQLNSFGILELGTGAFSSDQSKTLQASRVALTPGAIEGGSNYYLRDNLTGARQLIAAVPGRRGFREATASLPAFYGGGTANWSNLLIRTGVALRPGDPETPEGVFRGEYNLYQFRDGRFDLVSVRPREPGSTEEKPFTEGVNPNAISTDGSRIAMTPTFGGPIYMRIDGEETIPVSVSANGAEAGKAVEGQFQMMSADGNVVYFASGEELIAGDDPETSLMLYRYDVATKELTDPIASHPGGVKINYAVSGEGTGSVLYFLADGVLTPDAKEPSSADNNLYALYPDGKLVLVGEILDGLVGGQESPNGRYYAFQTYTALTPDDRPGPDCTGGPPDDPEACRDVYVFDAQTEGLACATCTGSDRQNATLGEPSARLGSGPQYQRRVLDDGTVFVQTTGDLVPSDHNGYLDVYAWRAGGVRLVSTGTAEGPSVFAGAAADGSSAFFLTAQSLVPIDRDQSVDVYADRELGGLASQQEPPAQPGPCEGESCRGAPPIAPPPLPAGSEVGGGGSCVAISRAVGEARREATGLARGAKRAARAAKRGDAGAEGRGRRLRRRAKAAHKRADGLKARADRCRRAGR